MNVSPCCGLYLHRAPSESVVVVEGESVAVASAVASALLGPLEEVVVGLVLCVVVLQEVASRRMLLFPSGVARSSGHRGGLASCRRRAARGRRSGRSSGGR